MKTYLGSRGTAPHVLNLGTYTIRKKILSYKFKPNRIINLYTVFNLILVSVVCGVVLLAFIHSLP